MKKTTNPEPHVKLTLTVPRSMARRLRRYWHAHELPSQSEAWRQVVEAGFKALDVPEVEPFQIKVTPITSKT